MLRGTHCRYKVKEASINRQRFSGDIRALCISWDNFFLGTQDHNFGQVGRVDFWLHDRFLLLPFSWRRAIFLVMSTASSSSTIVIDGRAGESAEVKLGQANALVCLFLPAINLGRLKWVQVWVGNNPTTYIKSETLFRELWINCNRWIKIIHYPVGVRKKKY